MAKTEFHKCFNHGMKRCVKYFTRGVGGQGESHLDLDWLGLGTTTVRLGLEKHFGLV